MVHFNAFWAFIILIPPYFKEVKFCNPPCQGTTTFFSPPPSGKYWLLPNQSASINRLLFKPLVTSKLCNLKLPETCWVASLSLHTRHLASNSGFRHTARSMIILARGLIKYHYSPGGACAVTTPIGQAHFHVKSRSQTLIGSGWAN